MASIDMQQHSALHNPVSPKDTSWDKQNYMDVAALRLLEKELDELKKAREARRVSMMTSSSAMQQPVVLPKPTRNRRRSLAGATPVITTTHPETSFSDCSTESDDISVDESSGSSTCTDPLECEPQKEHDDNGVDIRSQNLSATDSIAPDRSQVTQEQVINSNISQKGSCTPWNSNIQVEQQKIDLEFNEKQTTYVNTMDETRLPEIDDCDTNDSTELGSTQIEPIYTDNRMKNSPIKKTEIRPRKQESPKHDRKPLRIDTKFTKVENLGQSNNETPLYSEIRRSLRSTPSPPNPSTSKSATLSNTQTTVPESKPSKRVSLSHIQTSWSSTNTSTNSVSRTTKSKSRPLSDAFIGVKGLTRKFDTATGLSSPNKTRTFTTAPLSEASLSVCRERKTSLTKGGNSLTQLFSPPTPKEQQQPSSPNNRFRNATRHREPKPLPPIGRAKESTQQPQQQQRIVVSNNETTTASSQQWKCSTRRAEHTRISRKSMPPIPKDASSCPSTTLPYPNPLPVYEPQLTRKASPLSRDDDDEETSSLETNESKTRKRVSFSSIVVDIPPPSPYTDDDDNPVSPKYTSQRLNTGGSSSAHILSRWQQQHQRDRLRNAIRNGAHKNTTAHGESKSVHSGTRGFWESFNKEMMNSSCGETSLTSTTDNSRHIVPESTRSLDNRFVPSPTYKSPVHPLPSTSETTGSTNNTIRRYNNKTWINALQSSVSSRLSFRTSTTQLSNGNKPSPWLDKGSNTSSSNVFDQRAATSSPPLNHPTKTRPMKPSSLRKRSSVMAPTLARPPAAAQPQWWSRVDHP
ncbi:hypothetical protein K492DRAFT_204256 [Lichtheimia hyalospora FSU 10163]|nr:hypothetical protein K492DRAFT_204256 [Lichtheimia hyalospora FSU 10163]